MKGLQSLHDAIEYLGKGYTFDVYLTDDGSTDGTVDAIMNKYPKIRIIQGDGTLFWNRGMLKSWIAAIESDIDYNFYLWYNDDTVLFKNALLSIFNYYNKCLSNSVISGALKSSKGDVVTYGGYKAHKRVVPNGKGMAIDYMNGNIVLIPKTVVDKVGVLDPFFRHSYGDWEYGARIRKNGFPLLLTPSYVGICDRHDDHEKCYNSSIPLQQRFTFLLSPTGHHPREVFHYGLKSEGILYALKYVLAVIMKTLFPKY